MGQYWEGMCAGTSEALLHTHERVIRSPPILFFLDLNLMTSFPPDIPTYDAGVGANLSVKPSPAARTSSLPSSFALSKKHQHRTEENLSPYSWRG